MITSDLLAEHLVGYQVRINNSIITFGSNFSNTFSINLYGSSGTYLVHFNIGWF